MKTSTATLLGAAALTAAVVGFGVAIPSIAEDDSTSIAQSADPAAATDDPATATDDPESSGSGGQVPGGGGPGAEMRPGAVDLIATAAEALGLSEDELLSELQAGSTLGQLADQQGVERQELVDALLAGQEEELLAMLDEPLNGRGGMGDGPGGAPLEQGQSGDGGDDDPGTGPWQPGSPEDGASGTSQDDGSGTTDESTQDDSGSTGSAATSGTGA